MDPVVVRLLWAVMIFAGGVGVPAYILAWIIIPEGYPKPHYTTARHNVTVDPAGDDKAGTPQGAATGDETVTGGNGTGKTARDGGASLAGLILVAVGTLFWVKEFTPWFRWGKLWPLVVIALGVMVLLRDTGRWGR